MSKNYADVVLDLRYGDSGKGKIVSLLSRFYNYDYVMRFHGGQNAGHTIVRENKTHVLHMLPTGVVNNKKCIIGRGCVFNVDELLTEIESFEKENNTKVKLFIDKNAHLVTKQHLEDDMKDSVIGTTKKGVGPAYTDKYKRIGQRAESCAQLERYLCDTYNLLYNSEKPVYVLCEGSQGFELDIDWSENYPYVTSSHCHFGNVFLNGIQEVRTIYGVAKVYDTYVGLRAMQPQNNEIFEKIVEIGKEYGSTTRRKRQINWLNVDRLAIAAEVNRVSVLFLNKLDVLIEVDCFTILKDNQEIKFNNQNEFIDYLTNFVFKKCPMINMIHFGLSEKDTKYLTFYRDGGPLTHL